MIGRRAFVGLLAVASVRPEVLAQPAETLPRIAVVHPNRPVAEMSETGEPNYVAFFSELRRLGRVEAQTILVHRWSGEGRSGDRDLALLAERVVESRPDVIFAASLPMALAFGQATSSIPVVFTASIPDDFPYVDTLSRPGGNLTGLTIGSDLEIHGKHIQLLIEVAPAAAQRLPWLGSQAFWATNPIAAATRDAAAQLQVPLVPFFVANPSTEAAVRQAFSEISAEDFAALFVGSDPTLVPHGGLLAELAVEARLPTIGLFGQWADAGFLMSYGPNFLDIYRRAAGYVDRILAGADPAEMPIEQPIKFDFIINLGTAEALGITLPPTILAFATEVIE